MIQLIDPITVGVVLTEDDLKAVEKLFKVSWAASIRNWKERGTNYCMWVVSCPDNKNTWITETGVPLVEVISKLLSRR